MWNGAFAQVLSQCMRVTPSECVGGRVKNECHFECMNAVVFVSMYHQEGKA